MAAETVSRSFNAGMMIEILMDNFCSISMLGWSGLVQIDDKMTSLLVLGYLSSNAVALAVR